MFSFFRKKEKNRPRVAAVIAAAGRSTRMGEDKLMMELDGLPVLVHCLLAFEECPSIDEILVVTTEESLPEVGRLCRDFGIEKVRKIVRGGDTRTRSVLNGLLELSSEVAFAAIHDGARPLVTGEVIEEAVEAALDCGAAAPGVPVKDTVKWTENGMIQKTLDREKLVLIQTPQVFDIALIKAALTKGETEQRAFTDECMAVEALGAPVRVTRGSYENIKLTTIEDLDVAEAILRRREEDRP